MIIAPLAWGLGHATRCMPIVAELLKLRCEVYAVLTEPQQALFTEAFGKKINTIPFDEVPVHYKGSFAMAMVRQLPQFSAQYRREQSLAGWLTDKLSPDLIISDNRYGFKHFDVPSVFIGHQMSPKVGFLSPVAQRISHKLIQGFDAVWIPDNGGVSNLSGELSRGSSPKTPTTFIGPLTRLKPAPISANPKYHWVALLSGPEPQRTMLEEIITEIAKKTNLNFAVVAGQPEGGTEPSENGKITRFPHLKDSELVNLISNSQSIICRSGYSTLCDLAALQRQAILIPTPGQTEQEYLAKHFSREFSFEVVKQREKPKLETLLTQPEKYSTPFDFTFENTLKDTLRKILLD